MRGNITRRLLVAIGVMAVCIGLVYLASSHGIPHIVLPQWHLKDCPKKLDPWTWNGEKEKVDSRLFRSIGAVEVEDRIYQNASGTQVKLHTALFDDTQEGLRHSPMNCYRDNGWTKLSDEFVSLTDDPESSAKMCVSMWEQKGVKCLIGYWYQLGDEQVFDRVEFSGLRWRHIGQREWPPMVKVLIHINVTDTATDSAHLNDFGRQVYQWLHHVQETP
ncbi:MAG: exosortase-associated EpsI family protein [Pirellulales bacterium]|nr:exosortase-associated EpsI family protein [Pirellulales bacterium]